MMNNEKNKALIYCRVSDPKQKKEGHGLASQEHRCRQYAESKGFIIDAEPFLDDITGGGSFSKRPAMMELLDYLKLNQQTNYIVIVDDILRASRDVYFYWDLIYKLEELGAQPMSPNFVFERTPEGNLQQSVTVAAGAYQREAGARQTRQKMVARLEAGYHVFIAPAGFKFKKTKEHGKLLVRDEPIASIIAEAIEGFASGRFQTKQEVRYFFEFAPEFPKTKSGKIGNNRVTEILSNPLYAGYVAYKPWGVSVRKGQHEGMVSYETFLKAQERLSGRAHAPARKDLNRDFPMRGSVLCECGNALTSCMSKSCTGKYYPYYLCQNKKCGHYGKSIKRDVLEGDFEKLLQKLTPSRELITVADKMFRKLWGHRANSQNERKATLEKLAKSADQKIEKLLDRIIETDSPTVVRGLEKRVERLEDNKRVINEKLVNCGQQVKDFDDMYRTAMQFLSKPYKLWALGRYEEKKAVIKLAFTDRLTYVRNEGYRTPDLSLPFKMLDNFFDDKNVMVPRRGLEPPRPCGHQHLKLACLPISPPGHNLGRVS